ncbi:hypothetical protein EFT23_08940 [Staphylococcus pseudintermedius]|nr:hypothetical protein [Staphylococcus pseudintermedius]
MGLCTNSNYRLNNPEQELFGSCPGDFKSFKNQYSIKKIQTSKHNEIFLFNIYDKGYKSSPDSCVKCYTMFLPFLLIKIDVFS